MEILQSNHHSNDDYISYREVHRDDGFVAGCFHSHDNHEISLITGSCTCQITCNKNSETIHAPALVLMKAGSFHGISHIFDGDFSCIDLSFHPQIVFDLPQKFHHMQTLFCNECLILPLTSEQLAEFLPLFQIIKGRSFPESLLLILSVLCHLQTLLENGNQPVIITSPRSFVFDLIEMIQTKPEKKYTITELAEHFHVSQTKLKADFKRIAGMPIHTFRQQARLRKALMLMQTTEMSLAQISYICGYSDESHFIDAFRAQYALTPGAYRRQCRQEK